MEIKPHLSHRGSLIALLIGAPIGLLTIAAALVAIYVFVFEQNPWLFLVMLVYASAIVYMSAALIVSLWFVGRYIEWCVLKDHHLLLISIKSSFMVSLAMWATFAIRHYFAMNSLSSAAGFDIGLTPDKPADFILPVVLFFITFVMGSFTAGLLVCFIIKRRVKKALAKESINNSFNFH